MAPGRGSPPRSHAVPLNVGIASCTKRSLSSLHLIRPKAPAKSIGVRTGGRCAPGSARLSGETGLGIPGAVPGARLCPARPAALFPAPPSAGARVPGAGGGGVWLRRESESLGARGRLREPVGGWSEGGGPRCPDLEKLRSGPSEGGADFVAMLRPDSQDEGLTPHHSPRPQDAPRSACEVLAQRLGSASPTFLNPSRAWLINCSCYLGNSCLI